MHQRERKFWPEEKREKNKEKEEKEGILHTSLLYHAKIPVQTSPRVAVSAFFRTHVESTITPLYTSQMTLTASKKPFFGGVLLFIIWVGLDQHIDRERDVLFFKIDIYKWVW